MQTLERRPPMNLITQYLTRNMYYHRKDNMPVKGILVHSTGCNNPNTSRYTSPWDSYHSGGTKKPEPHDFVKKSSAEPNTCKVCGGQRKCVHAFIGKDANGNVHTVNTLSWNYQCTHCDDTRIGFEICEDGLTNPACFTAVYREAVELCAMLYRKFGLVAKDIICHSEAHNLGLASYHADDMNWFPKHGKSVDTFRAEAAALLCPVMQHGDKGTDVMTMQRLLNLSGLAANFMYYLCYYYTIPNTTI